MATLLTKIHRAITRELPALTVRRVYDYDCGRPYYEVRGREGPRSLDYLGNVRSKTALDEMFELFRSAGYRIDEVVQERTWLCTLEQSLEQTP